MRIRRIAAALCVALLLTASLAGCSRAKAGGSAAAQSEPLKIGAVLSLTGTYAAMGASEKNALELEVKRINDAGGINGRPIELVIEDDGTDEAKAVAAATKLIDKDEVLAILGATGTGQTMAMRSELQRAGVAEVSMAGGTVITSKFDKLVFQTPWSNTIVVPFVLSAIEDGGYTNIALLSDTGGYGKDGRDVVIAQAKKAGITIVSDQTFNPGDTDVSAQITKIKAANPQALLLWTAGKEAALAVKTARDLGVEIPIFGGSGQARAEFAQGAGDAAEGFVFGTGKSLIAENWGQGTPEFVAVSDFATRYEQAFGAKPDIFAGHAFDAISIITDALKRAGEKPTPAGIRDAIEQTKGLPGFGGVFTFTPIDHNGLTSDDLALYVIEGGQWAAAK